MPATERRAKPYDVFRPRNGRRVAQGAAIASVVIFTVVAFLVPAPTTAFGGWRLADRITITGLGLLIAAGLWRYAQIRAVPDAQGLDVYNLVRHHRVEWSQVLAVQFSGGAPWLTLDLADTERVAVMAIQKSDGQFGKAQAARLVALVQHHGTVNEPGMDGR